MKNIKYSIISILMLLLITLFFMIDTIVAQSIPPYASDQPISGPRIFTIPGGGVFWHITFTPDGSTYYVAGENLDLMSSSFINQQWTVPKKVDFVPYKIETPFISPDGNKFFITKCDTINWADDIYVMDKTNTGWSEPKSLGEQVNSKSFDAMATATADGDLYFLSNRDGSNQIYYSKWLGDHYSQSQITDTIFRRYAALSPFISQDGNYLLFVCNIEGSNMYGDIFISFNKYGLWSIPRNLGTKINTSMYYEDRPFISPDGNYLFFCSSKSATERNIYQIDWRPTLASLKKIANWNRAFSSSNQSAVFIPENVLDDDLRSRWSSQYSDSEWIMVKLDSASFINKVTLRWESAYGKQYEIQTSLDSLTWQTVFTENNGNGGKDSISFNAVEAKYIRMKGIRRGTSYGYSLYEFKIYKANVTGIKESKVPSKNILLNQNYPNPFNPKTLINYQLSTNSKVELKVIDLLGREVSTLVDYEQAAGNYEVEFDGGNLASGIYIYKISAGSFIQTKKMLLMK